MTQLFNEAEAVRSIGNDKFTAYHNANPSVWVEFEKLANRLWDRGIKHYGSKGICEVIRYHTQIDARPGDKFKVNNNYSPMYAKLYLLKHPDRKEFFDCRERKQAA